LLRKGRVGDPGQGGHKTRARRKTSKEGKRLHRKGVHILTSKRIRGGDDVSSIEGKKTSNEVPLV